MPRGFCCAQPGYNPQPLTTLSKYLARPEGFEPPAYRSVVCRSIQLSYGRASPGQNKWWGNVLNPALKLAQWSAVFQKTVWHKASRVSNKDSRELSFLASSRSAGTELLHKPVSDIRSTIKAFFTVTHTVQHAPFRVHRFLIEPKGTVRVHHTIVLAVAN